MLIWRMCHVLVGQVLAAGKGRYRCVAWLRAWLRPAPAAWFRLSVLHPRQASALASSPASPHPLHAVHTSLDT